MLSPLQDFSPNFRVATVALNSVFWFLHHQMASPFLVLAVLLVTDGYALNKKLLKLQTAWSLFKILLLITFQGL
jgi:hypothetical protein